MKILNKKAKILITTLIVSMLFMACGKDDDNPNTPTSNNDPFTFLKVGYEWEYDWYNVPGYSTKSTIVSEDSNYFRIIIDDNENFYTYWYSDGNNWQVTFNYGGTEFKHIQIHRNCYVGQKWNTIYDNYTKLEMEVLSISDTVTVPAGTFYNCIKIKESVFERERYYWIHKDIGEIMHIDGEAIKKLISKNF